MPWNEIEGRWDGADANLNQARNEVGPASPTQAYGSGGFMMGQEYGPNPGHTWAPDADARYRAEHSIDPNTGMVTGPLGPVPAKSGPLFQAAHEQAVWQARQRRGQSAANYMKGALGLLQSYRPGGGAALESGIYQNLASVELQRANLLQPMDLLGDYRRDVSHQARKAAKKQQTISTAVQIAGIAASVAAPYLAPAFMGAAAAMRPGTPGGDGASTSYAPQGFQSGASQPGGTPMTPGAAPGSAPGGTAPGGPSGAPGGAPGQSGQPGAGPTQRAGLERDSGAPGQPGAGGAGGAAGGRDMGYDDDPGTQAGMPGVGVDGRFDPLAYAQQSAMRTVDPVQQVLLSSAIAYQMESDDALQAITGMIDARLRQRMSA